MTLYIPSGPIVCVYISFHNIHPVWYSQNVLLVQAYRLDNSSRLSKGLGLVLYSNKPQDSVKFNKVNINEFKFTDWNISEANTIAKQIE